MVIGASAVAGENERSGWRSSRLRWSAVVIQAATGSPAACTTPLRSNQGLAATSKVARSSVGSPSLDPDRGALELITARLLYPGWTRRRLAVRSSASSIGRV